MYTKGEWKACKTPLGGHGLMIDKRLVADIRTDCPDDAQLIAAAPLGYELAEQAVKTSATWKEEGLLEIGEGSFLLLKRLALELITKAEGRE